jgi:predicted ATPase/DNA-binding SARP family transcriptional activator
VITATDTVRVGVLGPLEVTDAVGRPVHVGGQRVRALLILLALDAGRVVSARSLIERLWPDERPTDAANALQSLVSRLRVALRQAGLPAGVLESSAVGYRLAAAAEAVDALAFEAAARRGREALASGDAAAGARLLREALARWRGPALADVAGEEFAAVPAARLAELRDAALLDRIEADLALGEAGPVLIGELRELTAADPLAERPTALLMRALAATGRQAEALAVYQRTRESLADSLGVDPSPQLDQAYLAVLRREVPPAAAPIVAGVRTDRAPAGAVPDASAAVPGAPARPVDGAPAASAAAAGAAASPVDGAPAASAAAGAAASPVGDASTGARPADTAPVRRGGAWNQPNSFVGRDQDLIGVLKQLSAERLVTLTGPGGVGKTRLAAEAAARLADSPCFAGSAWFAALAPVTEPSEVPYAVLDALGLRERSLGLRGPDGAADPLDRLCTALAASEAVLILDNCEHLIDAAAALAARLLADCPRVRVLATSREPLGIGGETLFPVGPLAAPPASPAAFGTAGPVDLEGLASSYPAVRLFADRAVAVLPSFALSSGNEADVARICRALDGMPLAIELAAPWLRTLAPAQLAERLAERVAERLDDRFALLTGGSRTAQPRHQTLRAVVDWSWQLLSEPERALARRLAVFPAGATLAAAEQVCAERTPNETPSVDGREAAGREAAGRGSYGRGSDGRGSDGRGSDGREIDGREIDGRETGSADALPRASVLSALSGLIGKSIIAMAETPGGCAPRYRMLETVRAYGLERLAEAGEESVTRDAFARYYLDFAETADPLLRAAGQIRWFRELLAEQDNVNAALRRAIGRRDSDTALRLVRGLGYYWFQRGYGEGEALAREVLALTPPEPPTERTAEARVICAMLAAGPSFDLEAVKAPLIEAIADLAVWGDDYTAFHPLVALAEPVLLQLQGERERAQDQYDRYDEVRDPWLRAMGLVYRASNAREMGRLAGGEDHLRVALREYRAIGEQWGSAIALTELAEFTELRGDHAASLAALEEAVSLGRELTAWGDLSYVEARLAIVRARTGELAQAGADLDRVDAAAAARGGTVHIDRWVTFIRAELAWREGDLALAARCCADGLAALEGYRAAWWAGLRARLCARFALVVLAQDDESRCRDLLAAALDATAAWTEHSALADVLDACACYAIHPDKPGVAGVAVMAGATDGNASRPGRAELAARLLGAAHAVRGAFDESSPDAPQARAAARAALGEAAFEAAYQSAGELTYEASLALARETLPPVM